ncbi:MAG TPA: GDSL-type esterase/lipase family protein [Planctomycetaceae bacterium]|nr:GDSL-type esterase/lipase family protein [Planctomycetaceae bacterium]
MKSLSGYAFVPLVKIFCVAFVLFLSSARASEALAAEAADEPQWIWATENAGQNAPPGRVFLRTAFELVEPDEGRVEISCDNAYTLFVNGQPAGTGNNWQKADGYDIKTYLTKGRNCIAVMAENSEGPAGLVARVMVKAKGREAVYHSTGKRWKTSTQEFEGWRTPTFDDSSWKEASVIGPLGKAGPWGEQVKLAGDKPPPPVFTKKERPAGPFQLLEGDRIVFIGDALIERAQNSDYLETLFTARYPNRELMFRNLGWSGDTPFGDARAGFGSAAEGFEQLKQGVYGLKPTVIFAGYGGSSSFDGQAGLARFQAGLGALIDMLAVTKAEIILLSPIAHEDLGRPLPDPAAHNRNLELYASAIQSTAASRGLRFVDLFHRLGAPAKVDLQKSPAPRDQPARHGRVPTLTSNGIHLTDNGYWLAAAAVEQGLDLGRPQWEVALDKRAKAVSIIGTQLKEARANDGKLSFRLLDERLPEPPSPFRNAAGNPRVLRILNLAAGRYALSIDEKVVARGTAEEWASGIAIKQGPDFEQIEKLRQAIVAKNRLYFYRWRPQNETYLFGFRKHEQGQNAREVPMYDPLVAEAEGKIARLRVPAERQYGLARE